MADTYEYRVRDSKGSMRTGEIAGDSRELVMSRLRELGFIPLELKVRKAGLKREISLFPGRVKKKDLAVFSRQFATMVNSGLPLLRALSILEEQTESKELVKVVGQVRQQVAEGSALSAALAKHPKAFSRLYVAMVRAGETGGVLDSVLLRLADTTEREVTLRQKIKSAMTYPIAVLGLVFLVLLAMLVFVVPTFKEMYSNLGGTLPLPTRVLLTASNIVKSYLPVVLLAMGGAAYGFMRWVKTDRGREIVDNIKLKLPIFGSLFRKTAMARFSRTLGVLERSGVPVLQSLDIVAETVNSVPVAKAVRDVQSSVREGESLAQPLTRHAVFPPIVVQMLAVGEETGSLDTMLDKTASFYEEEVSAAVESLTSLIEPLLVAVVGGVVGAIVISLYLPMFGILDLIK